jgi:hypothetical protein
MICFVRIVAVLLCGDVCVCMVMACDDAMTWLMCESVVLFKVWGSSRDAANFNAFGLDLGTTRDIASTSLLLHHEQESMRLATSMCYTWESMQSKWHADRKCKWVSF